MQPNMKTLWRLKLVSESKGTGHGSLIAETLNTIRKNFLPAEGKPVFLDDGTVTETPRERFRCHHIESPFPCAAVLPCTEVPHGKTLSDTQALSCPIRLRHGWQKQVCRSNTSSRRRGTTLVIMNTRSASS
jgi:hypothetical protein